MAENKRWKTKEEAQEYISKAIQENNLGLSYCAACDFLGAEPVPRSKRSKRFLLGVYEDSFNLFSDKDLKDLISELEDSILTAEYVENHKFKDLDETYLSAEDILKIAKHELAERHFPRRQRMEKRYRIQRAKARKKINNFRIFFFSLSSVFQNWSSW